MKKKPIIFSLGGSLIVPNGGIDTSFLKKFSRFIRQKVVKNDWQFLIVTGGGATARHYQEAAKKVVGQVTREGIDWIGIYTTHLNSHLMRMVFKKMAHPEIIDDYQHLPKKIEASVVLAAGDKPGSSTDYDAVLLAQFYGIKRVINLSDVDRLYTRDPNRFAKAEPIDQISWSAFRKMFSLRWRPGMNVPFDPIASRLAQKIDLEVVILDGRNLGNLDRCLLGKKFVGTIIKND